MADTKVETIARLAQWNREAKDPNLSNSAFGTVLKANTNQVLKKRVLLQMEKIEFQKRALMKKHNNNTTRTEKGSYDLIKFLMNCDLFDGNWPCKPGSCSRAIQLLSQWKARAFYRNAFDQNLNLSLGGSTSNDYSSNQFQLDWKRRGLMT